MEISFLSAAAAWLILAMAIGANSKSQGSGFAHEQFSNETVENKAAGNPTDLWSGKANKAPYPTNTFWQNFVLQDGSDFEYIHPYMVQSKPGNVSICYPNRVVKPQYIYQAFVADLSVSCEEQPSQGHVVTRFDDLSVTLQQGRISIPLVRGSPYVTFRFRQGTPSISTVHRVADFWADSGGTKHKITLSNNQTWIVYSSAPLSLDKSLKSNETFDGVIRIALLPDQDSDSEAVLDKYSSTYAVGGSVNYSTPFEPSYRFTHKGDADLLLLNLPIHRGILASDSADSQASNLKYNSIDGQLQGYVGDNWSLKLQEEPDVAWHSSKGILNPFALHKVASALSDDINNLSPITTASTYFAGKALARAARLALIAEEIGHYDLVDKAKEFLSDNITPWLNGSFKGNGMVFDSKWGGLISIMGASDPSGDFGLGVYNDHHFHWGYFAYAGAVLAKFDDKFASTYKSHLYALVADYMSPESTKDFPTMRHFDPWLLHSWAGGLTQFDDGRNQESTSEAVNAYYAASLLGLAYGDDELANLGLSIAALESYGAITFWHVALDNKLYEEEFVEKNRVVGVLWANKRDTGLWFAAPSELNVRLGIQVLPLTPMTEYLFGDLQYNKEAVEWAMSALSSDGWKGFVYALQATYDPSEAALNVGQLQAHDDGNSLSNLLWWIYSR